MKKERQPIKCAWCDEEFVPRGAGHKFCSKQCATEKLENDKVMRERARYAIFERDQFRCVYCGQSSIEDYAPLVVDHIIPVSEGGHSGVDNLVTACFTCNARKANSFLEESVYLRIIERNKRFNLAMTPIRKLLIERVIGESAEKRITR